MTTSSDQATADLALLPLLQTAIPSIIECTILDTILQANAQGCRVMAATNHTSNELFVKRIMLRDFLRKKRQWNDLRRTLLYGRTEVRFYKEILPLLRIKGFDAHRVPTCHAAECNLHPWIQDDSVAWKTEHDSATTMHDEHNSSNNNNNNNSAGSVLVLDSIDRKDYYQESPLNLQQAAKCLEAVAHLHAAAWEDPELLEIANNRMARGSYHLSTRNPKELEEIQQSWNHFVTEFHSTNPHFFSKPSIVNLGERMSKMAEFVSHQLTPSTSDDYATLTHGDYKAMNVFLPRDSAKTAVMIDFASTGVGYGMSDVAMHVIHAVRPNSYHKNDELFLVNQYLEALEQARVQYNTYATPFPRDLAFRQYRLACIDYMRFVLGRFYKSATIQSFETKKESKNVTLVNRDLAAAVTWIERVDTYLHEFEEEKGACSEQQS